MPYDYDAFLSYHREDADIVKAIALRLMQEANLRVFLDEWPSGQPWQAEIEGVLDRSATCVVFVGPHEPSPEEQEGDQEEEDEIFVFPMPEFRKRFYSVTWAVNHACNLHCTHCYDVVSYRRQDLNTEKALNIIDRLSLAGVTFIAFSGGEAFLRKDLFQLMAYCKRRGMDFGARSNGTRITKIVARQLKELGISVVGVSFDGATPQTHDAVRGAGAFYAALAGLQALRAEGIRTQMEVVLSQQNAHEALAFIELGETVGASEVNFSTMAPQGRAEQRIHDLLDPNLWLQLTEILREASRTATIPVTPNCALLGPCFANIEPHVTCEGWLTPCYLSSIKLFNVLETPPESIRELLRRGRMKYQDVCGRRAWTQPAGQTLQPTLIPLMLKSSCSV